MQDMIIFTKSFDCLKWLLLVTNHFPKSQRFLATKRLLDAFFDYYELITTANNHRQRKRLDYLIEASAKFDAVQHYFRLSHQMLWLNDGQYQHGIGLLGEIGRLLGGWLRQTRIPK